MRPVSIWREVPGSCAQPHDASTVVTIGNFDGVHRGHQYVLGQAKRDGNARELPVVAVTFDPLPLAVLAPDHAPARLSTLARRIELLKQHGADDVHVLAFDADMASWTPHEFIDRILVRELSAASLIVGENFRFGHKAAGDVALLSERGAELGFSVTGLELEGHTEHAGLKHEAQVPHSSTLARRLVSGGDLPTAATVLGRPHEVCGSVVRGDQRGTELGFPTANMPVNESYAVPPDGVYAGWLVGPDGTRMPNAISVGTNPTFNGAHRRIESHVIDRTDLELYDAQVRVEFISQLRPMHDFSSVDELVRQMHADIDSARTVLDEAASTD